MTTNSGQKDGLALMEELYLLTNQMVEQRHDADFLLEGVEKRQELMDAYDRWAQLAPTDRTAFEKDPKARQTVDKILSMDQVIVKALEQLKLDVQKDSSAAKAQQKVIGYLGNAISSSGSYMDVKLK